MEKQALIKNLKIAYNVLNEYNNCDIRFQEGLKSYGEYKKSFELLPALKDTLIPASKNNQNNQPKNLKTKLSELSKIVVPLVALVIFINVLSILDYIVRHILALLMYALKIDLAGLLTPINTIIFAVACFGIWKVCKKLITRYNYTVYDYNSDLSAAIDQYINTSDDYSRMNELRNEYQTKVLSILPKKYASMKIILVLLDYLDGRADTLKEALNLFEQEKVNQTLIAQQAAIQQQGIANANYLASRISSEASETRQTISTEGAKTRQKISFEGAATRQFFDKKTSSFERNRIRDEDDSKRKKGIL